MGLLIALCVTSASKALGPVGVSLGLLSAAVMLFALRNWFDDSSLFSLSARVWSPLLLGLAVLTYLTRK